MDVYQKRVKLIKDNYLPSGHVLQRMKKVRQYMEENYATHINIEDMASTACFSRYHFIRQFKLTYGRSPYQFLRDIRISRAKRLLQQGKSVSEVCFAVGYDSLSTFSGLFKRATGLSPMAYQQLYKSNFEEVAN